MKKVKVKDWLPELYELTKKSDYYIYVMDAYEMEANSEEEAKEILLKEEEKDLTEREFELIEIYNQGDKEFALEQKAQEYINKAIISKGKSRRKSSPKVFGD